MAKRKEIPKTPKSIRIFFMDIFFVNSNCNGTNKIRHSIAILADNKKTPRVSKRIAE
jgi:hypothetical protein